MKATKLVIGASLLIALVGAAPAGSATHGDNISFVECAVQALTPAENGCETDDVNGRPAPCGFLWGRG